MNKPISWDPKQVELLVMQVQRYEQIFAKTGPLLERAANLVDALLYETDEVVLQAKRAEAANLTADISSQLEDEEKIGATLDELFDQVEGVEDTRA